jgi:hypothetical protein
VQLDKTAELKGMSGWQGAGWTSPGPGTHHVCCSIFSISLLFEYLCSYAFPIKD